MLGTNHYILPHYQIHLPVWT